MPPQLIKAKNGAGMVFEAYFTGFWRRDLDAFQYRIMIPQLQELSLVCIDVSRKELSDYCRTKKPVVIKPPA